MKVLVKPIKNVENLLVEGYCEILKKDGTVVNEWYVWDDNDGNTIIMLEDQVNSDDEVLF